MTDTNLESLNMITGGAVIVRFKHPEYGVAAVNMALSRAEVLSGVFHIQTIEDTFDGLIKRRRRALSEAAPASKTSVSAADTKISDPKVEAVFDSDECRRHYPIQPTINDVRVHSGLDPLPPTVVGVDAPLR